MPNIRNIKKLKIVFHSEAGAISVNRYGFHKKGKTYIKCSRCKNFLEVECFRYLPYKQHLDSWCKFCKRITQRKCYNQSNGNK